MASASFVTSRAPAAVLDAAQVQFAGEGFTTTTRSETQVSFEKVGHPNGCLAVGLCILLLIPGIIYILVTRGTSVVSITAATSGQSTNVAMSWSGKADNAARAFVESMRTTEPPMAPVA